MCTKLYKSISGIESITVTLPDGAVVTLRECQSYQPSARYRNPHPFYHLLIDPASPVIIGGFEYAQIGTTATQKANWSPLGGFLSLGNKATGIKRRLIGRKAYSTLLKFSDEGIREVEQQIMDAYILGLFSSIVPTYDPIIANKILDHKYAHDARLNELEEIILNHMEENVTTQVDLLEEALGKDYSSTSIYTDGFFIDRYNPPWGWNQQIRAARQ